MTKLQMKIADCFRTWAGTERSAPMQGLIETAHKRQWNLLDLLRWASTHRCRSQTLFHPDTTVVHNCGILKGPSASRS